MNLHFYSAANINIMTILGLTKQDAAYPQLLQPQGVHIYNHVHNYMSGSSIHFTLYSPCKTTKSKKLLCPLLPLRLGFTWEQAGSLCYAEMYQSVSHHDYLLMSWGIKRKYGQKV